MASDEVRAVDGLAVTSVERTSVDVGRTLPLEQVVVMADAARRRLVTADSLAFAPAHRPRVRGLPAARRALASADGRAQYGRLLRPGQDPGDAVHAEKLREDGLRAEGLAVVRRSWADLGGFAPVAARLRHAFATVHT